LPRVGIWLVPAGAPGTRIEETWDQLGMRATGSHDVVFDDVLVPADHAVDVRPIEEWRIADAEQAAWNALVIAALYHGIAEAARDWLAGHLRRRAPANLGAPLASLPRIQEQVGEIEAALATGRHLLASGAASVDAGAAQDATESGLVKLAVTRNAIAAVERALTLTSNAGLARRNPLERLYRDVLCGRIHTPQEDSVLLAAGRAALAI
jgi:alkylation response protein AidB-like acyl-CoA dehydrogenase